jgi:hypothetical protein
MGRLADAVLMERLTVTWQLHCLPTCLQYCRATPAECLPFLGKPVSSTTPGEDGRTGGHLRQNVVADGLEEELVIPGRYRDDVMQGSMSAPDIVGVKTGGHGCHACAFSRQEEAEAVAGQRLMPVPVSCRLRQNLKVGGKALVARVWRRGRLRRHSKTLSRLMTQ